MGNLIGEPFKDYVSRQIISRQKVHGKQTRTLQELQYLNSKNAWIKLASGTSMEQRRLDLLSKSGNPLVVGTAPGLDLAVNNVLFNGFKVKRVLYICWHIPYHDNYLTSLFMTPLK